MTIDSLFQWPNNCCGTYTSVLQQMIASYYAQASNFMFDINDEIYSKEVFGKDTEQIYNRQNDFHYLLILLVIIYNEQQDDIAWGISHNIDYYYNEHNLGCIRRNFLCKGYDIISLLRVFNMDPNMTVQQGLLGSEYLPPVPQGQLPFTLN